MSKKEFVQRMFNDIAPGYDKLNHILSLNIDKCWRKKAVRKICAAQPSCVLDVACGTGDFSIALAEHGVPHVIGVDISEGMLDVGRKKVEEKGLHIELQIDDCEHLSFQDASFDAVSVAFGVRNFEHLSLGLTEMYRVLSPGGIVCIVELSVPRNPVLLWIYKLYFIHILPRVGGFLTGNTKAYRYLPASVIHFPKPDQFCSMMYNAGFQDVEAHAFTFGLCRMFIGKK